MHRLRHELRTGQTCGDDGVGGSGRVDDVVIVFEHWVEQQR